MATTGQFEVVEADEPREGQALGRVAFFNADGTAWLPGVAESAVDVSVAAAPGVVGDDVQAVLADLAARVVALEEA